MKRVTLHIGHVKTGSSAIQSALALNCQRLFDAGIDYPYDPSFEVAAKGGISSGNITGASYWLERVVAAARKSTLDRVLFSNELLMPRVLDDAHLLTQQEDMIFEIVLFVRNPADTLYSSYGQSVKRGGNFLSLDEFSTRISTTEVAAQVVAALRSHDVAIHVINYSTVRDRLIETFCRAADLPHDVLLEKPQTKIVNRSLTKSELEIQKALNEFYGKGASGFFSDPLVNRLPEEAADLPFISRAAYQAFAERTSPAVAGINALLPAEDALIIEDYRLGDGPAAGPFNLSHAQIRIMAQAFGQTLLKKEAEIADLTKSSSETAKRLRAEAEVSETAIRKLDAALADQAGTLRSLNTKIRDLEAENRSLGKSAEKLDKELRTARGQLDRIWATLHRRIFARLHGKHYNPDTGKLERCGKRGKGA